MNFLASIAGGIWGTIALTLLIGALFRLHVVHLRFGQLLGEVFLSAGRTAEALGLTLHVLAGIGFALTYGALWDWMGFHPDLVGGLWMGSIFGIYHFLVQMPLIGLAKILHPKVRSGEIPDPGVWALRYGPAEALSWFVGHVMFGALVGVLIGLAVGWIVLAVGIGAAAALIAWGALTAPPGIEPPQFMAFLREEERPEVARTQGPDSTPK